MSRPLFIYLNEFLFASLWFYNTSDNKAQVPVFGLDEFLSKSLPTGQLYCSSLIQRVVTYNVAKIKEQECEK
jgi:hypothetical protein